MPDGTKASSLAGTNLLHNEWVFGNVVSIESLNPIVNLRTFDNQGDLDLTNIPSKKWKYIRHDKIFGHNKWRDVLTENDVNIECICEAYIATVVCILVRIQPF